MAEPPDDFEEARRGLIAPFDPPRVEDEDGRVVWELESYDFLDADPPATANPELWRQSQLCRIAGLFEIAPGFFQLRGFDLSNMHVVEGREGIVVIDPLVSAETAAAALALYREHRGDRPVTGLIYTHSHVDHFGGAKGVLSEEAIEERRIPIVAPPASSTTRSARTSSPARRWRGGRATCTGRCSRADPRDRSARAWARRSHSERSR